MAFNSPSQKGHRDRTSPTRVARTSLEAQALRLRREGHAFDEIAEMLGISGPNREDKARYLVTSSLERKGVQDANALRTEMLDRMDRLFNRAMRIALKDGSDRVAAINAATSVAARMAALVGADAPKQVDLKDDRQLPSDPATRSKFLEELARKTAATEPPSGG